MIKVSLKARRQATPPTANKRVTISIYSALKCYGNGTPTHRLLEERASRDIPRLTYVKIIINTLCNDGGFTRQGDSNRLIIERGMMLHVRTEHNYFTHA